MRSTRSWSWIVPPRDVVVRPLRRADCAAIASLFSELSPESLYQRFHSAAVRVDAALLDRATAGRALVAETDGRLVGLASYVRVQNRAEAEAGIVVEDCSQHSGIGSLLYRELLRDAERAGIRHMLAIVMRSNHAMLRLVDSLDLPLVRLSSGGALEITIQLGAST